MFLEPYRTTLLTVLDLTISFIYLIIMVVLKTQSEVGHAPPPQAPYSVITNLPGWDVARAIREGDPAPMKKLVHIYPRFMPTHYSAQVSPYICENNVLTTLALAWA